MRERQ